MSNNPCYPCSQNSSNSSPAPCPSGEPCLEFVKASCVVYDGPDAQHIGVKKGDRLHTVVQLLDKNQASNPVDYEDTDTIDGTGMGIPTDKVKFNVKLNPSTDNVLKSTSEGLQVKFDRLTLVKMLDALSNDDVALGFFCDLVAECMEAKQCAIPTLSVTIGDNTSLAITQHPVGGTREDGQSFTFTVAATGTGTLSYQWKKNGTNISGATNAQLTLTNVTEADQATYTVEVSNGTQTLLSQGAVLTVNQIVAPVEVKWGWFPTDPYPALQTADTLTYQGSNTISSGAPLVADFRTAAPNSFFVVRVVASEPVKTTWVNTVTNYGVIGLPDPVFRQDFVANGFRYYVSRDADQSFDQTPGTQAKTILS